MVHSIHFPPWGNKRKPPPKCRGNFFAVPRFAWRTCGTWEVTSGSPRNGAFRQFNRSKRREWSAFFPPIFSHKMSHLAPRLMLLCNAYRMSEHFWKWLTFINHDIMTIMDVEFHLPIVNITESHCTNANARGFWMYVVVCVLCGPCHCRVHCHVPLCISPHQEVPSRTCLLHKRATRTKILLGSPYRVQSNNHQKMHLGHILLRVVL